MPDIGLILFLGIVAFGVYSVRNIMKHSSARRALLAQHPDEPWLWRRDWAERAVRSQEALPAAFLAAFGVLWLLISLPPFFLAERPDGPMYYVLFLFPAAGVLILFFALRQMFKRAKYGVSLCRLERVPIAIGSTFRGEIQTRVRELPERGFQVRLSCINRVVTGSGKQRSTREDVLWQDEQTVGSGAAMPAPDGMRVPFRFDIPADCQPCDDTNPRDTVLWRLEIAADVPGIDYSTSFEVPVFRTSDAVAHDAFAPAASNVPWTPSPSIQFAVSPAGGEEIVVRPHASVGDWLGYIVFIVIFFAALMFVRSFGAPLFVVILFGLFGALVFLGALDFLAGVSRIRVDRNGIHVLRTALFLSRARTVAAADIHAIESRIGKTSGGRALYEVRAIRTDARTVRLAKNLRDKRDAEGIARVRRQLGM